MVESVPVKEPLECMDLQENVLVRSKLYMDAEANLVFKIWSKLICCAQS